MTGEEWAPEATREITLAYTDTPEELEPVIAGSTTDAGSLHMFHYLCGQESDAWVLHALGMLPRWWRLVYALHIRNLSNHEDTTISPEQDAQLRLADLSELERAQLRIGWRVIHTSTGGRIMRLPGKPIVRNPEIMVLLERMPTKVLGPYQEFLPV